MPLYNINNSKLEPIKKVEFKYERELQKLTEDNLEELFGLKFVASEFQLDNLRIDTLAFNEETKSFVIIEYKKGRSYSVIDQGYSYLGLLLNNKAEFVLKYNQKFNKNGRYIKNKKIGTYEQIQTVIDYISGMTDSYALNLHKTLLGTKLP